MSRSKIRDFLDRDDLTKEERYNLAFDIYETAYVRGMALAERPHEKWEYLKEHITEMRDADGKLNQKETCQFILNLMGVIEREGDEK